MYYKIEDNKYASVILTNEESQLIIAEGESTGEKIDKALAYEENLRKCCGISQQPKLRELSLSYFDSGEMVYIWLPEGIFAEYDDEFMQRCLDKLETFFLATYLTWEEDNFKLVS